MPTRRARASIAVAIAIALAGCGAGARTLNGYDVERGIARSILAQRDLQSIVSCPKSVPIRTGRAFTCMAGLQVGWYPLYVTETDDDGHVRWSDPQALVTLDSDRVRRAIAGSITAQRGLHALVSCPVEVLQQAGVVFTCRAMVGDRTYPFTVTEVDGRGHVRYIGGTDH